MFQHLNSVSPICTHLLLELFIPGSLQPQLLWAAQQLLVLLIDRIRETPLDVCLFFAGAGGCSFPGSLSLFLPGWSPPPPSDKAHPLWVSLSGRSTFKSLHVWKVSLFLSLCLKKGCDGVHSLSRVQLFTTPWSSACQAFLSFTISQSLLRFKSVESAMLSKHLILTWAYNCRLRSTVPPWERLHLCFLESSAALRSPMHSGTLCVLLCKISSSWGFPFTVMWLLLWIFVCLFACFFFGLLFWLWISGPFHQTNFVKYYFLNDFSPPSSFVLFAWGF